MPDKDPAAYFREVVTAEGRSVLAAATQLSPESITAAVRLVQNCSGKLTFLGIGKSGLVARKIAATFASTGVTAIFVHAADALHGDLGLVGSDDVVVMLSNSGETDELTSLLPHLDRRRVPLIAIVGDPSSTIGRHASVSLHAGVEREACPLNLAPTSSTTVALAIGDALAMTVALLRGLTHDDFAVNHPSGRLGKRLTLRVADFLRHGEKQPVVSPEAVWRDVVLAVSEFRLGAVNVIGPRGKLIGLITDGDLRRALARYATSDLDNLTAAILMTPSPITTTPSSLAYDALKLMHGRGELGLSVLPVINESGCAIGLVRLQDLTKAGI